MSFQFSPPKIPNDYPDRPIDCQVAIDNAFRELWENIASVGWGSEEIACALYELIDNHLTALRENAAVDRLLPNIRPQER